MKKIFCLLFAVVATCAFTFTNNALADDVKEAAPKEEKAEFSADVPENASVEEYFSFIEKMQKSQNAAPRPSNRSEFIKRRVDIGIACNKAAGLILADKDVTEEQAQKAIEIKFDALSLISQVDAKFADEIADLIEPCKKYGMTDMVQKLEVKQIEVKFQRALNTDDANLAEESLNEMIEKAKSEGKELSKVTAQTLLTMLDYAEYVLNSDKLGKAFEKAIEVLEATDNGQFKMVAKSLKGQLRRATLVGNEMLIGGKFIDDTEYKAEDYEGKVVLVDFWATWCGPCRGEIPNVKKLYKFYHEKGFEIIGISSDRDIDTLKKFIEKEEMPWKQMMRNDAIVKDESNENITMGAYYGVTGIPTMILIGKDGKVITTNARGAALKKALEQIYGPMEE